jgi:hypothetical protein
LSDVGGYAFDCCGKGALQSRFPTEIISIDAVLIRFESRRSTREASTLPKLKKTGDFRSRLICSDHRPSATKADAPQIASVEHRKLLALDQKRGQAGNPS